VTHRPIYSQLLLLLLLPLSALHAQQVSTAAQPVQSITTAGQPAQLVIRQAGDHSIRITLKPLSFHEDEPFSPALADRSYPAPDLVLTQLSGPVSHRVGALMVQVSPDPLTVKVSTPEGTLIQQLIFRPDTTLSFLIGDAPLLGLGEGGHKPEPGVNWRLQPIEFDRRGRLQEMSPRWQSDAYGSRNPVPLMIGTEGCLFLLPAPGDRSICDSPIMAFSFHGSQRRQTRCNRTRRIRANRGPKAFHPQPRSFQDYMT